MGETPHLNLTHTSLKPHLEKLFYVFLQKSIVYFKKNSYLCGAVLLRAFTLMCHSFVLKKS